MNIFIIGFMFSGKSTIGKKLAQSMNMEFIDTDKYFENKYNITINDFFKKYGEELFRDFEHKILLEVIKKDNCVISTGGGLPCFNNNIEIINQNGLSVYINMALSSIIHRQALSKKKRPLLDNLSQEDMQERMATLLKRREIIYEKADIIIKGENIDIKELQEKILSNTSKFK